MANTRKYVHLTRLQFLKRIINRFKIAPFRGIALQDISTFTLPSVCFGAAPSGHSQSAARKASDVLLCSPPTVCLSLDKSSSLICWTRDQRITRDVIMSTNEWLAKAEDVADKVRRARELTEVAKAPEVEEDTSPFRLSSHLKSWRFLFRALAMAPYR